MTVTTQFQTPNPHAVSAIITACRNREIIAARDIVDLQGIKLWARDQRVTPSLQQKLLERKLRTPLESCLRAKDGVTTFTLSSSLKSFLESPDPLAVCVVPWRRSIEYEVARLPLHSVVQLLLTASQEARAGAFEHSIRGMAVAGALAASQGAEGFDLRMALLGGLLHDIGETYIHPDYLDPKRAVDAVGVRHLSVHPRIGGLLLSQLTDYPAELSRAVDEHHERLDGSGYPLRREGIQVSPLGRLLAVTETVLGVVAGAPNLPLTRASFGLGLVAHEFDQRWTGVLRKGAQLLDEQPHMHMGVSELRALCRQVGEAIERARQTAEAMAEKPLQTEPKTFVRLMGRRLSLLKRAWDEAGLWALSDETYTSALSGDAELLAVEMRFRLRSLRRDLLLRCTEWPEHEAKSLDPLSKALSCDEPPAVAA